CAVEIRADLAGLEIDVGGATVGVLFDSFKGKLVEAIPVNMIGVDDRDPFFAGIVVHLFEESPLRFEVGIHGAMVVEMILGQIRKYSDIKTYSGDAVLGEAVRGDLHDHGATIPVAHLADEVLQVR